MSSPDDINRTDDGDRVVDLLTRALHDEAETVDVDPAALHAIRSRLAPRRKRGWWIAGSAGAGLATAAAITAVVLIGSGTTPTTAPPASQKTLHQPTTHHPSSHHSLIQSYHPHRPPQSLSVMHPGRYVPGQPSVDLYYISPTAATPNHQSQLYVEPHSISAGSAAATGWQGGRLSDGAALAAVQEFFTSTPIDQDYTTGWPEGVAATSVTRTGDTTSIALTGTTDLAADCPTCPSWSAALQALARTAGLQAGDTLVLTYNGTPVDGLHGVSLPVTVLPMVDVRASIQITSPVDGQSVSSPVTVTGDGNVFEGTVNWELLDSTGAVVKQDIAMTAQGEWRPFSIDLGNLAAGQYTIRCYEASAKDGSAQFIDDKTFTVQ